jgi:hypothetical protein
VDDVTRFPDWPERLQAQIDAAKDKAFSWGAYDCCMFSADCAKAMTGHDYAAEYRDRYKTKLGALRQLKCRGGGDIPTMLDRMMRTINPKLAGRGDICLILHKNEFALAVIVDHRCIVPAIPKGLVWLPKRNAIRAWKV